MFGGCIAPNYFLCKLQNASMALQGKTVFAKSNDAPKTRLGAVEAVQDGSQL